MNLKHFLILAALNLVVFFGIETPVYSQSKSILKLADAYSLALKNYETQKSARSLENVLRKGTAVSEKLEQLETLNDKEYSQLEKTMRGFVVNRDEIIFVKPDARFFKRLAVKRGTRADVAFFNLMLQIRPDNVWAAYIEQQTDISGCTIYGNGLLTKLYGKAQQFKNSYPKAYVDYIDGETTEILNAFTENLCACGGRNSVVREFRLFIKTYPKNKNIPVIKKRLTETEKSKDFRFNCQSG